MLAAATPHTTSLGQGTSFKTQSTQVQQNIAGCILLGVCSAAAISPVSSSIAFMRGLTGALVLESSVQSGSIQGINDRQAG